MQVIQSDWHAYLSCWHSLLSGTDRLEGVDIHSFSYKDMDVVVSVFKIVNPKFWGGGGFDLFYEE